MTHYLPIRLMKLVILTPTLPLTQRKLREKSSGFRLSSPTTREMMSEKRMKEIELLCSWAY